MYKLFTYKEKKYLVLFVFNAELFRVLCIRYPIYIHACLRYLSYATDPNRGILTILLPMQGSNISFFQDLILI